ncbi:phosphotransferase, partial [Klebsiella pneumoniae]|uniref:phosphotransferase n=1 Tax=Klebsiella pneumoniae TaxID=573 RepID=UPI0013D41D9B
YDNRRLVLRKQPPGDLLPSAHAIDREYRVISALAGTDVPVPPALLYCDDRGIVGTPFYVMERLEGRVFHDCALDGIAPQERRSMYR